MFNSKLNLNPFYYPDDGSAIEDKAITTQGVIDLLKEDDEDEKPLKLDEKKPEKETKEDDKEEDKEEEVDELKEFEEELEDVDDEKLELVVPVRKSEILAKYPKIFKDFPHLEKAYYREKAFTEILPTIDDAKEAVEKAEILDKYSADLNKGDLEKSLRAVKESGEEAFSNLVDNYLSNLGKVDNDARLHIIGNIIKSTVVNMIEYGKSNGDEDLEAAAKILNRFVFQTNTINQPTNLSKPKSTEKDASEEVNKERQQLFNDRFEAARDDLDTRAKNVLKATIAANIDPKESMSEYVRKNAARDAQERLDTLLDGDRRLRILLDQLWKQSAKENFSRNSQDKIKSAYLSRAKTLLPTAIKQARNEALKGIGKRVTEDDEEASPKKGPLPVGKSASQRDSGGKSSSKSKIPDGMSSKDFLMSD